MKTSERPHWCCSDVFIANFEHISHILGGVSIVDFERAGEGYYFNLTSCYAERKDPTTLRGPWYLPVKLGCREVLNIE